MARLGAAFALTDISAMFGRPDGRVRFMRMLVSIPDDTGWKGRGRASRPSGDPRDHGAAWMAAMLAHSASPIAPVLPPCPIETREPVDA